MPDAPAIHSLLLVRLPRDAKAPPAPVGLVPISAPVATPVPEETEAAGVAVSRNAALDRAVRDAARSGKPYAAARLIERTSGLSVAYAGVLRGEAAQILFTLNRDEEAYGTAATAVGGCRRSVEKACQDAALPGYVAGLAAWRMGQPERARPMFEQAWRAELSTSSIKAGAAFWAARVHLRGDDRLGALPWMARAAEQQNTFYGLLARRGLGLAYGLSADGRETLAQADVDAVAATEEGLRAFALLQIDEIARAEAELRRLWARSQGQVAMGRAIMLVATQAGMSDLAAGLADIVQAADGRPRSAMRFAVPRLRPAGGFRVDPAMLYALARTESNFDSAMVSPAGARGLLQIMPETARFITRASGGDFGPLHDPSVNLDLGQRYVAYLAGQEAVAGDLIRLLASYNSGPGNFGRWRAGVVDRGDPLLFIEAIPIDETRAFVPRVLAYTWIYAARLGVPAPSLDELAQGVWPRYHPPGAGQDVASLTH